MSYFQDQYLIHFGIKGQKHGVRRFQNEDGTLTSEGEERYGSGIRKSDLNKSGTQVRMASKGIYEYMKRGSEARAHIRDNKKMYKKSVKATDDKEYKSDMKEVYKGFNQLSKKYAHGRLNDADKVNLAKGERYLDEVAAAALAKHIQKNRKNIRFG